MTIHDHAVPAGSARTTGHRDSVSLDAIDRYWRAANYLATEQIDLITVLGPGHGGPAAPACSWLVHRLAHRRAGHANLHVRGYKEQGTTTTPFDMLVGNDMDRFKLVCGVVDRVPGPAPKAAAVRQAMTDARARHREWIVEHGEDLPEIRDWAWAP